ncbi:MAG: hypothetical protein Q8N99_01735 [Nanoarchaeota archaeon]|nr:hypothetical protein [Nanoarchaeota archaeon]
MKKLRLKSIGNSDQFNFYIFEKNKDFFKIIIQLFTEVFGGNDYLGLESGENIQKLDIFKLKDKHESLNGVDYRVDIFYGEKVVYMTLIISLKLRKKFNKRLEKYIY